MKDVQDSVFDDAVRLLEHLDTIPTSVLQEKLQIGYSRAARLLDQLEDAGYVGNGEGEHQEQYCIPSASVENLAPHGLLPVTYYRVPLLQILRGLFLCFPVFGRRAHEVGRVQNTRDSDC